jgi:ribosomal protein S18 acetylase RimI-like enzyme
MAEVRVYSPTGSDAMMRFATSLSKEDRNFLKEDASDPHVLDRWSRSHDVDRFVAIQDGDVVGYVGIHPLRGWSSHVSEVRVLVAPEVRGQGLGQRLVQTAVAAAIAKGMEKLVVEVVADQGRTIGMLQANGFVPEALLADHIRDRQGHLRDLMVLSCRASELAGYLELVGVNESLDQ